MTDIGKAYVQIIPKAQGIEGKISQIVDPEAQAAGQSSGESFAAKFTSIAKKVISTAGSGIGKIISESLNAGGAIQQSFGGLDTIYGEASAAAKNYAQQAAAAGISANEYAEQAVSFGASLKQAFGGDVTQAAEAANTAIMDMADNSAKFGTDISSVQAAYQGFAKQNYTMLDNLKLGYGGTKTEMERLLARANEINAANGKITNYSIDNLGDVYEAIHVVQEELGVAGVAAGEAETTLTGSFGAMKAAAENFLAALSTGGKEMDITPQLTQLANSTSTWLFGNFLPMIGNILKSLPMVIGTAIQTGLPMFIEQGSQMLSSFGEGFTGALSTLSTEIIPLLFETAQSLITSLGEGISVNLPILMEQGLPMLMSFTEGLRANFGSLVDTGLEMLINIANGIIQSLPALIAYVPQIISNIAGLINDNAPKLISTGLTIISNLVIGLWNNRELILSNIGNIFQAVIDVVLAINWIQLGGQVIKFITSGVKTLASQIPGALKNIGQNGWNAIKSINWSSVGSILINLIKTGVLNLATGIPTALKNIGTNAWNAFKSVDWLSLGSSIVNGIISGISSMAGSLFSSLKDLASNALQSAKNFLGIKSPSRVFAREVGKWIPLGIAEGIEDNTRPLMDSIDEVTGLATAEAADLVYQANASYTPTAGSVDARLDAILALMTEYFPEMAKSGAIDGNMFISGIDRALGLAVK